MQRCYRVAFLSAILCGVLAAPLSAGIIVQVDNVGNEFSYTLFNDEPVESSLFISAWRLTVAAPVTVIGTPAGWTGFTDGKTFVQWQNPEDFPFPHDIPPQSSLGGFVIRSTVATTDLLPYIAQSYDHDRNVFGPTFTGSTLAPSVQATAVPEPLSLSLVSSGILGVVGLLRMQRKQSAA